MSVEKWPDAAPRKRIWVQHVAVETDKLQMRVAAARARGDLTESQEIIAEGVAKFAKRAQLAAFRDDPIPNRLANWWRGTLPEAAYRQMHAARAQMIDLYDENELQAEIPSVVARANASLHRDDPRQLTVEELRKDPPAVRRARIRRLVADSYERLDLEHAQLRSFRNILLSAAALLILITIATIVFVSINPELMPLCFPADTPTACPTSNGSDAHPQNTDIQLVAVLGALGGALAATLAIRNLKGTSTPYDVPVALAALKVPLGALTAILGLVAIQGEFVPGLSQLDSQGQILAYALVLGFAQQAFSRLLDQQAQTLLEGLPGGKDVQPTPKPPDRVPPPPPPSGDGTPPVPPAGEPGSGAGGEAAQEVSAGGAVEAADAVLPEDATADRPVDEPEDATQQDQFDQLRDTINDRRDMSEEEEADLLQAEFGPPDAKGIYGAPTGSGDAPAPGAPSGSDKEG